MFDAVPLKVIEELAAELMEPGRLAHCRATGLLARELCVRFGADPGKGFIAGLFHDAARGMTEPRILELASGDGLAVTPQDRRHPMALHGRAAAVILRRRTGYDDEETLWAIRDHVTGRPGMGPLSRIVFAADYLEPTRGFLDLAVREMILRLGLDAMVRAVLAGKIEYLQSIRVPVAAESLALKGELER